MAHTHGDLGPESHSLGSDSGPDAANSSPHTASSRPHVTVKWAQTLDGRAAATDGSSQWITGPDARGDVHRRRAEADAILVGTGTLHADDPSLTARAEAGGLLVPASEQPIPVVFGRRQIPSDAKILLHPALEARGLDAPWQFTGDDFAAHLAELHERGVRRLFIEGGPTIASEFIKADLVDEVLIYIAPTLLGGPRLALGDIGVENMAGIKQLRIIHAAQLGADLLIKAAVESTTTDSKNGCSTCTQDDEVFAAEKDDEADATEQDGGTMGLAQGDEHSPPAQDNGKEQ